MSYYNWNIGTINIRTGKDDEKLERVVNEISKANLSICGLQEVCRLNNDSAVIKSDSGSKYEVYWSGYVSKRTHGVGIVIKIDPSIEIIEITPINARIITADVIVRGCSLKIINCYAPTEDSTESSKIVFYRQLNKQLKLVKKKQKVICIGDFNATTSACWSNTSLREGSVIDELTVNDNGLRFHGFFNTNKLSVLNTWFTHKKCRRITWHSNDGVTKKVYDFILCSSWLRQFVMNCRVFNSFDFDSDHRLVIAKLSTPSSKKARFKKHQKRTRKQKINFAAITQEMTDRFSNNVTGKLEADDVTQSQSNKFLNDSIINALRESAENVFPTVIVDSSSPPWRSDEKLKQLFVTKSELVSCSSSPEELKRIRKKIRYRVRYLKDQYFKHEAETMNTYMINKEIEKLFTKAKRQECTLRHTHNSCPTDKLYDHFKSHFNPEDLSIEFTPDEMIENIPLFVKDLQDISEFTDINDTPPSIDEIHAHIQKLKNNKASNDIEPELLKRCTHPIMLEVIHRITNNQLWSGHDLPISWGQSLLRTLWKGKGSKKDPS
eukprot:TCONS_00051124-protein